MAVQREQFVDRQSIVGAERHHCQHDATAALAAFG
jgi:hypothetical protein